jgi:hypothetical protein
MTAKPFFVSLLVSVAVAACGGDAAPSSPSSSRAPADPSGGQNEGGAESGDLATPAPSQGTPTGRVESAACTAGSAGECQHDADCAESAPCGCAIGHEEQNLCLSQSNCKVNSDCSSGETCNLSTPFIYANTDGEKPGEIRSGDEMGGFYKSERVGYFCTTPEDECVPGEPTNAVGDCVFTAQGKWQVGSMP